MGFALALSALLLGYLLVRAAGSESSPSYAGGSGPASFEPKAAVEILRSLLLYTIEAATSDVEASAKFDRIKLHYQSNLLESDSAFHYATEMNKSGYAILGSKSLEGAQPWGDKAGQLLFVLASDPEAIAAMASKDSPWAVLVRVPGKLTKFASMSGSQVRSDLRVSDIV